MFWALIIINKYAWSVPFHFGPLGLVVESMGVEVVGKTGKISAWG
jgi:hypothetical protein